MCLGHGISSMHSTRQCVLSAGQKEHKAFLHKQRPFLLGGKQVLKNCIALSLLPWQKQVSKQKSVKISYWNTKFQGTVVGPKMMRQTKDSYLDFQTSKECTVMSQGCCILMG